MLVDVQWKMSNSRQVSPDPTDEERDPQLGVNNNNNANNMEPDGAGKILLP